MAQVIDKREAMLSLLRPGVKQSYVPAGFFLHFDKQFHKGRAAIDKHKEFFRATGMDFVKIQFELDWPQIEAKEAKDWGRVPRLTRAFFEPQLEVVEGLVKEMGSEALVILTLYSPFMILAHLGDRGMLMEHMAEDLEAVRPGIEQVTEDLTDFVRRCAKVGLDGFYHSTQGGEDNRFADPAVFDQGIKPYDLEVMQEIERLCHFNILHVCDYAREWYGGYSDLTQFQEYPGHVVNCSLEGMNPEMISAMFHRPFMGGIERLGPLATGSAEDARAAARQALGEKSDRFILAADCTVPATTPWENLAAAIDEAHLYRG
ncbi:MAG TPA: uroporphyrinogen decarboxylase family protein [Fimbriimonadaceae bacterium]|nr:uroporphyrinogen decarboxylase family protein [Fimbriimonadaceae bacterium]